MRVFIQSFLYVGLCIILLTNAYADIGPVEQLRSISHPINQPTTKSQIKVTWQIPDGYTQVNGYYYQFDTSQNHEFTELNTAGVPFGNHYDTSSQAFTNVDDQAYYFHIAAEDRDDEIGPTSTLGPFRIDDIAPKNAIVSADDVIFKDSVTLTLGASGAYEMFISNLGYGTAGSWESYNTSRQWNVTPGKGSKIIYVQYRDAAGNTSRASTTTRVAYQRIPLHAGWNLISYATDRCFYVGAKPNIDWIPGIIYHQVTNLGNVLETIANQYSNVYGFYSETKSYNPLNIYATDMTYLAPGYGYWIRVNETASFDSNGYIYLDIGGEAIDSSHHIPLNPGWNLVGYTGENVRYTGSVPDVLFSDNPETIAFTDMTDIFCSISNDLLIVQGFDTEPRSLNAQNVYASNMKYVGPGFGYWIKVKTDSQNVQLDWNACNP